METRPPRLLDVKTAARYLSISRSKLYQWIEAGRIKTCRIDGRRLIDIQDLDAFIENLKKWDESGLFEYSKLFLLYSRAFWLSHREEKIK